MSVLFPLPDWTVWALGIAGICLCAFAARAVIIWALAPPAPSEYERQQFRKRHEQQFWPKWTPEIADYLRREKE